MSQRETVPADPEVEDAAAAGGPAIARSLSSTTLVPPLKVICPLHGIRTLAVWQKGLSDLASTQGWACRLDRWSYGRFSMLAFFTPWTREAKLNWLRRQYDAEIHDRRLMIEQGQTPSVVAHSFGTYILGYTLLRFDFIRFNKVILCGSILPRDFPWDRLIERGQVQAVRNEYGVRDPWVKRVCCFVRGTGPSGASGFTCKHDRLEQEEFEYDHGDYFGTDHMEDRWLPFLNKPLAEIPRAEAGTRISRPPTPAPWCLYGLVLTVCLAAVVLLALLWVRGARPRRPPRPPSILSGYVINDDSPQRLAGVTISIEGWDTIEGWSPRCTTDELGQFRFENLRPSDDPAQPVKVIARKPGFKAAETDLLLGSTDQPIKLYPKSSEDKP
jgi:hypothetical protein